MEIETKDGIILRGIPDGTPDDVIKERIAQIRASKVPPKPLGPPQELSWAEKNLAPLLEKPGMFLPGLGNLPDVRNNPVMQGVSELGIGLTQAAANSNPVRGSFPGLTQSVNDAVRKNEEGYQASRGKDAGSFDAARLGSSILNPLALGAAGKLFTAMPSAGARIAIPSIYWAGQGGSAPVTDAKTEGDYDKQAGKNAIVAAILSSIIPGGWEAAKAGGRTIRNVTQGAFNPEGASGRLMNEASGSRAPAVRESLLQAEAGQTAQQAVVPSGSTEAAALIEIAKKRKPSDFRDIAKGQQETRIKSLEDVGGSDAALATAKGDRAMAASQLYGDAMNAAVKADSELAKIASNPYFKDAVPEALKVMESRYPGQKPGNRMTEFLQVVKEGLDQKINAFGDTALNKDSKREAVKVQERILSWLDTKNPDFAKARGQYAKDSVPVNQAQVLQLLGEKAKTPLDVAERPGVFAAAVKDAPKTVKNATGREYSELSDVLSPQQQKVVDSILKQFQTDAYAKEMARAGMDKAGRLVGDMSHVQGTGLLNRYITLGTSALRKVASGATDKTMDSLAELSKDPKRLAEVMAAATPGERKAIVDALMQGQARAIGVGQGEQ